MDGPAPSSPDQDRAPAEPGRPTELLPDRAPARRLLLIGIARILLTVVVVLVVYYLLPLNGRFGGRPLLLLLTGLVVVGLLVTWQVRAVMHSPDPGLRAVEAIALTLPLFLVLFAAVYQVLYGLDPHSFTQPLTRTDGIYFVVTVFATVGFGDIAPVTEAARVATTLQMIGDLALIGVVLRIFLTAVDRGRRRAASQRRPPSDGTG